MKKARNSYAVKVGVARGIVIRLRALRDEKEGNIFCEPNEDRRCAQAKFIPGMEPVFQKGVGGIVRELRNIIRYPENAPVITAADLENLLQEASEYIQHMEGALDEVADHIEKRQHTSDRQVHHHARNHPGTLRNCRKTWVRGGQRQGLLHAH